MPESVVIVDSSTGRAIVRHVTFTQDNLEELVEKIAKMEDMRADFWHVISNIDIELN